MRFGRIAPLLTLAVALATASMSCGKDSGGGADSIDDLDVDDRVDLPTLSAPVDVVRDELGRPHVYAANSRDLAVVTGWLHAQDRFIQMDLQRRFANGTLAELVGAVLPAAVSQDRVSRAIGLRRAAQATWDALPAGPEREALLGYAEGVNAWMQVQAATGIAPFPDYDLFTYDFAMSPAWDPVDSLAIGRLLSLQLAFDDQLDVTLKERFDAASAAFTGLDPRAGFVDDVILRFEPPVEYSIVDPDLGTASTAAPSVRGPRVSSSAHVPREVLSNAREILSAIRNSPFNPLKDPGYGSNNWVVSGARTANGFPVLANDPHLSLELPPIWYELHLNTARAGDPDPIDVIGVSLPGVPVVIIGANGRLAWGVTNVGPDVTDIYVEQYSAIDTAGRMAVMWDDDPSDGTPPSPFELLRDDDPIVLRTSTTTTSHIANVVYRHPERNGGNAAIIPGTMTVGTNGTALSWAWTGFEPSGEVLTLMALARAESGADLQAAVDEWDVPPQNFVWADDQGHIGYVANGFYPVRDDDDMDPTTDPPYFPLPGHTGTHEWIDRVDRQEVPQETDPARGWIATANQDPLGHTYDNDPLNDDVYIGFAYDNGFRGYRIDTVLQSDAEVTVEDMMDLQGNVQSNLGERLLPALLEALGANFATERALLEGWRDRGFVAASGVGDDVPADTVDDAAATSLFNAWLREMVDGAIGDELDEADVSIGSQESIRAVLFLLERADEAVTYDAGAGESVLWDDLTTDPAVETQQEVFVTAFEDALAWLASGDGFGSADPTEWRWGLLHQRVLPRQSGLPGANLPFADDEEFPDGYYPRPGDLFAVDVMNFGLNPGSSFANEGGGGASMRMVIELEPGDLKIWNVIPGGSSGDPASEHYGDQAGAHARNEYFRTWYHEKDVAKHADSRVVFAAPE